MTHAINDHDDCTPCNHNDPNRHDIHDLCGLHYHVFDGRYYHFNDDRDFVIHYPTTNHDDDLNRTAHHDHNPTGGHHHHNKYGNILYCPNDDDCAGGARFSTYYDYEGFSFGLADHTH